MTVTNCPNLTSTHQVRKFIKSLRCKNGSNSSYKLYCQIIQSLKKTKVIREFSYQFVMKMIKHNRSMREIQLVINLHKSKYKQPSKIDEILFKTNNEILHHYRITYKKRLAFMNAKNIHIGISKISFSSIYGYSSLSSMKPIYSSARS
jgi:hypothetical protein